MIKKFYANQARLRRHQRIRRHLEGTPSRPRLNVFRSGQHIYAQVIDDTTGLTLAAASSLEASLRDFKPAPAPVAEQTEAASEEYTPEPVEAATEAAPAKGKGAKAPKADKAAAKAPAKSSKLPAAKTVLPAAQKGEKKTPVQALASIANNHKVALAREVGKLVGQRAKEKGVTTVVFDRGGYTYHGRVASLAEGAREAGLDF